MKIKNVSKAIQMALDGKGSETSVTINKITINDNYSTCTPQESAELIRLIERDDVQFQLVEILQCPREQSRACCGLFDSRPIIDELLEAFATKDKIPQLTLGLSVTTLCLDNDMFTYLLGREISHLTVYVTRGSHHREDTSSQFIHALVQCINSNISLQKLSMDGTLHKKDHELVKKAVAERNTKHPKHPIQFLFNEPDCAEDMIQEDKRRLAKVAM